MGCKIVTACASKTANRDAKEANAKYLKEDQCFTQYIIFLWILSEKAAGTNLRRVFNVNGSYKHINNRRE